MSRRKPAAPDAGETPESRIVRLVTGAPVHGAESSPPPDEDPPWADESGEDPFDAAGPSELRAGDAGGGDSSIDLEAVKRCAGFDHSDTDNGQRLIAHFGRDLTVMAQGGVDGGDWLHWDGCHWDLDGGAAGAALLAQKVGGRIALEAEYLEHTPQEQAALDGARGFKKADQSEKAKAARAAADDARKALKARRLARWRFAITSKNAARLKNMQVCAGPHLRKPVESFNRDPFLIVTQTHTLRLLCRTHGKGEEAEKVCQIDARAAHAREDYATGLIPCDYDPYASRPKWEAFLDRCMPDIETRRTVQQFAGTGLLGILLQRLMFHHGFGANGKSVFLAAISGVVGKSYGVSLPKETLLGQGERGAGQASPDLVRLFGKRMVRIDELKENESVREDLVKRLTGGDEMAVRNLFKGYFEFANIATPHMSGNGFPKIDGTDNGIWRRMLVVHWEVTIPVEERREFDEFVADLLTERSGILNWLLEGARDYLENGLFIGPKIAAATQEYREDMDPIGLFVAACVETAEGESVSARTLFEAYKNWAAANGRYADDKHQTRFGREMKKLFKKAETRQGRVYLDIRLHDVPAAPEKGRKREETDYPPPPDEGDGF